MSQDLKAAALLVLTMLLYATSDACVKLALVDIGVGQVLALRGVVICAVLGGWLAWKRRLWTLPRAFAGISLLRAVLEVAISVSFFTGLSRLPLADAVVIIFTAPIMMTLVAALFLRERVDARRWLAVVVGFIGVVVVAGPTGGADPALVFPIVAAVGVALRDLVSRYVAPDQDSVAVALVTALTVTAAGWITAPFGWRPLDVGLLPVLIGSGLCIALAYVTIFIAYRAADASFLAPFRYGSIPFAVLLGYLVFGERPGLNVLVGASVIVAAGLMMLRRAPPPGRAPPELKRTHL